MGVELSDLCSTVDDMAWNVPGVSQLPSGHPHRWRTLGCHGRFPVGSASNRAVREMRISAAPASVRGRSPGGRGFGVVEQVLQRATRSSPSHGGTAAALHLADGGVHIDHQPGGTGPAPSSPVWARYLPTTASSCKTCPKLNVRRNAPRVGEAIT